MAWEKKRTPGSVERHAANRERNETRAAANVARLDEAGRGALLGGGERPSRTLRRLEREQARRESAELLERIEGSLDGGDAA